MTLRSYSVRTERGIAITIRDAILATFAATEFSNTVKAASREFRMGIDGNATGTNPAEEVEQEALVNWFRQKTNCLTMPIKCFVSIGVGHPGQWSYQCQLTRAINLRVERSHNMAHLTAERFTSHFREHKAGSYFRFNLEKELSELCLKDYGKQNLIQGMSEQYLNKQQDLLEKCVYNLQQRSGM